MDAPTITVLNAIISAVLNVVILGLLPAGIYYAWMRRRRGLAGAEIRARLGLVVGDTTHLPLAALLAVVAAGSSVALVLSMDLADVVHERSPLRALEGHGPGVVVIQALLYGVVKTGLAEEILFRGLIAGALGRRLSFWAANLCQTAIFLLPHTLLLAVAPQLWWLILTTPLVAGLLGGWLRLRSGSILGAWMIHAAGNTAAALTVGLSLAS